MILFECDKPSLYATGDLHGCFTLMGNFIKRNLTDCALVVCGDIGFGFENEGYYEQTFNKLNKDLKKINVEVFLIRGNHDDPSYFTENGRIKTYSNIHIAPDYSVINMTALGTSGIMIGGAVSVDRTWRHLNDSLRHIKHMKYHPNDEDFKWSHWSGEMPVFDRKSIGLAIRKHGHIDAVFTHTCPSFCEPTSKEGISGFMSVDPDLEKDIDEERGVMDNIHTFLCEHDSKPSVWCYGHYHRSFHDEIDGTRFVMLDMAREQHNSMDVYDLTRVIGNGQQE